MIKVRQRTDTQQTRWQVDFAAPLGGAGPQRRWRLNAPPHVTSRSGAARWGQDQLSRVLRGELPATTREGREKAAEEQREHERVAGERRLAAITVAAWCDDWETNERADRVRETTLEARRKALVYLCCA